MKGLATLLPLALIAPLAAQDAPQLRPQLPAGSDVGPARVEQAIERLEATSSRLIRAARREMTDGSAAFPPQVGLGYEAFWLRDYAYMLEGCPEAFTEDELRSALRMFVGALADDGSGVDCIRFDGRPVYRPGFDSMGEHPVTDGGMFTVAVAWHTHRRLRDRALLAECADRLCATMAAVPRNPATGLVHIDAEGWDRCPYGFTDTVRKQGDLLFSSLLWIEAAQRLAELLSELGRDDEARSLDAAARAASVSVGAVLWDDELGLYRAATVRCAQPDVWGSAFAVHLGVAGEERARRIAESFRAHHADLVQRGQIRHLPGGLYWEAAGRRDEYQNGGYWAVPTGWFVCTLDRVDPQLARRTLLDLVADFEARGACEWVLGDRAVLPGYVCSATMALAGARALLGRTAR